MLDSRSHGCFTERTPQVLIKIAEVNQVSRISEMRIPFFSLKGRGSYLCILFCHMSGLSLAVAGLAMNSTIPAMNTVALGAAVKIGLLKLQKAVPCQLIRDCCTCGRHSGEKI